MKTQEFGGCEGKPVVLCWIFNPHAVEGGEAVGVRATHPSQSHDRSIHDCTPAGGSRETMIEKQTKSRSPLQAGRIKEPLGKRKVNNKDSLKKT